MLTTRNEYEPDVVSPPRETLRELLQDRSMTQVELAKRMGKTTKAVSDILSDTHDVSITPETALQLEQALGLSARFWLSRESAYRESKAKMKERAEHEKAIDWLGCLPLRELRTLGYITAPRRNADAVREALAFFRVVSVESWRLFWAETEVAYRMSSAFKSELGHLATWLRLGEVLAEQTRCAKFDAAAFQALLPELRSLSTLPAGEMTSRLVRECAATGVAVVFVPEFPKTHVSGAARWIMGGHQPLIALSLRHKTDDHLWFTFFHEACHILKHGKKPIYVDDENPGGARLEEEANRFARDLLIPPAAYTEFSASRDRFAASDITDFAAAHGISPGIVVGRLQHEGLLDHKFHSGLKRRFEFDGLAVTETAGN